MLKLLAASLDRKVRSFYLLTDFGIPRTVPELLRDGAKVIQMETDWVIQIMKKTEKEIIIPTEKIVKRRMQKFSAFGAASREAMRNMLWEMLKSGSAASIGEVGMEYLNEVVLGLRRLAVKFGTTEESDKIWKATEPLVMILQESLGRINSKNHELDE